MRPVAAFILILILLASSVQARVLTVDPGDSSDAKTLSAAVFKASPGDTIQIQPGRYPGAIIDRSLKIYGREGVSIEGPLSINAPGCEIYDLKINTSRSDASLSLLSGDCRVVRCTISGDKVAVSSEGSNNTIAECGINSPEGIEIFAPDNRIKSCSIQSGGVGVRINQTAGCWVEDCIITALQGVLIEDSDGNGVVNNTILTDGLGLVLTRSDGNEASGNNLSGAFVSGIDMLNSRFNDIEANRIEGGKVGISLRVAEYCNVTSNWCLGNERAGIYGNEARGLILAENDLIENGNGILLSASADNIIRSNLATHNVYGISLRGSAKNLLRDNLMELNRYNLRIDGGEGSDSELQDYYVQDIDRSNMVDGRPIYYLVGKSGMNVPEDCGFLGLVSCREISARNLTISNSSVGMLLVNSSGCRIQNSSIDLSEEGILLRASDDCIISGCQVRECNVGYDSQDASGIQFVADHARDCSAEGFRVDGSLNLLLLKCNSTSSNSGISLHSSRLCRVQDCRAARNAKEGLLLSLSHRCSLVGNQAFSNDRGIALTGSNACTLDSNFAISNQKDGISIEQLSDAEVKGNNATNNSQGIFVQSSKSSRISGSILCNNSRYGLRMSTSTSCNITGNEICSNQIAGINLVDCTDNFLYHNIIRDNLIQNAADNGNNHWDAGAEIGGNYWSDHAVVGDPGSLPRPIPAQGQDRYPFQHPGGWS
ncbi:right-handed parallel beta-helix repeat-containing protein [Methanothrix sp.]|uniref:right-handed parallel beta-helix repeat-containing protein n=1 Tax=Methanothrix sp. TaxID=90426 RepID=UPI003BB4F6CC